MDAYLDIETAYEGYITVIGIYLGNGELVQLVGEEVSAERLWLALEGVRTIYTYNGSRFDLPIIARCLGVDLTRHFHCHDLMYDCWRHGLYGGLKKVEVQLGIYRATRGLTGEDAMRLWHSYLNGDRRALRLLLLYNSEDVVNLHRLRHCLGLEPGEG